MLPVIPIAEYNKINILDRGIYGHPEHSEYQGRKTIVRSHEKGILEVEGEHFVIDYGRPMPGDRVILKGEFSIARKDVKGILRQRQGRLVAVAHQYLARRGAAAQAGQDEK